MRASLRLSAVLLALAAARSLDAQPHFSPINPALARSVSGQFVVYGGPKTTGQPAGRGMTGTNQLLRMEPTFAAVSCERIKQALTDQLGDGGLWRGKIYLVLQPAQTATDEITVIGERFRDGWSYRLNIPNPVEPVRLVRAVVQVLLLEQANRTAADRAAEIPLWLTEGLTQRILAAHGQQMLLAAPQLQVNRLTIQPTLLETRREEAATVVRQALGHRAPLTLEELSWPKENQLSGPDAELYGLSAQLFVAELLRFPDGRRGVRQLLAELPACYNWQTALLRAFRPHFERMLDVEKWWTLQIVNATGRDPGVVWSAEETWAKLEAMLQVSVQVRREKTDLPTTTQIALADVLQDWTFERQKPVLRGKLTELNAARQRVAEAFLPLVTDYCELLANYLKQREQAGITLTGGRMNPVTARSVTRDALKQLAALEELRAQAKPSPPATAQANAPSASDP